MNLYADKNHMENNKLTGPEAITVVIPARNEEATIAGVVSAALESDLVDEVLVVNNGSTDKTADIAVSSGARVVEEPVTGQGNALRTGYAAAKNDWVVKLDADLSVFNPTLIGALCSAIRPGVGLVKGLWHDQHDNMPMTRLMVRPAIAIMFSGLSHISAVNSGLFLFNRSLIAVHELTDGYGADLDVMLRIHTAGWTTAEADIGLISHDSRNLQHYNNMAEVLLRFLIDRHEQAAQDNLYVVTESAENVVASSMGIIAKKLKSGGRVTAFLEISEGYAVELLKSELSQYPTFNIQPITAINDYSILAVRQKATIITSYFSRLADVGDPVVNAALKLQRKYNKTDRHATLLMMPIGKDNKAVNDFRPDVRVNVNSVIAIKRDLQDSMSEENQVVAALISGSSCSNLAWKGEFDSDSIEAFQAFDHKDIEPPFVVI